MIAYENGEMAPLVLIFGIDGAIGSGLHTLLKMSVKEWKVDSNRVPSVLGASALALGWPSLATFASVL